MKIESNPDFSGEFPRELLRSQARTLVIAANGLGQTAMSLDDAMSLAWEMLLDPPEEAISGGDLATRLDSQRLVLLLAGVAKISGRSIDSLMQNIFKTYPEVPSEFSSGVSFSIHALDSFRQVVRHGEESGNGLLIPEFVVEDVARGKAFYAIKRQDSIAGTISLRLGGSKKYLQVEVERVTGANNADASPELSKLAQSLADSWTTARQLECWFGYARQCAEWWRLASDSVSQLSQ